MPVKFSLATARKRVGVRSFGYFRSLAGAWTGGGCRFWIVEDVDGDGRVAGLPNHGHGGQE